MWGHFFLIWLLKYLRKNSIPNKHVSLTQTQINKCQFSQQTLKPYWELILLWSRLLQFFLFWVYLLSNVTSTGATNFELWNPNFEFSVSIAIELLTTWFYQLWIPKFGPITKEQVKSWKIASKMCEHSELVKQYHGQLTFLDKSEKEWAPIQFERSILIGSTIVLKKKIIIRTSHFKVCRPCWCRVSDSILG